MATNNNKEIRLKGLDGKGIYEPVANCIAIPAVNKPTAINNPSV
jgi:hypothetical protein